MNEEQYAEIFCDQEGWKKVKGYRIDHNMLDTEYPQSYWTDVKDVVKECEFYMHNSDDNAFEDVWDCVDHVEKSSGKDFVAWRKENHGMIPEEKFHV